MLDADWTTHFFDAGFEETFRLLGKYDSTDDDIANLLTLIPLPQSARILDVPCGWGRHAGRLQARGFDVVGVDGSPHQIQRARQLWPDVIFHLRDMRDVPGTEFDAIVNLWTSFGSLPTRADDLAALTNWCAATVPGGYLIMELTTREYAEASNRNSAEPIGRKSVTINGVREDAIFDWSAGISYNTYTRDGWCATCVTRLYTRPELCDMALTAGYDNVQVYGGFSGGPVRDDRRTVVVAQRAKEVAVSSALVRNL